jgi:hypothetical protein
MSPAPTACLRYRTITIVLMILVAIASLPLFAPGTGIAWFGPDYAISGWTHAERGKYLLTARGSTGTG